MADGDGCTPQDGIAAPEEGGYAPQDDGDGGAPQDGIAAPDGDGRDRRARCRLSVAWRRRPKGRVRALDHGLRTQGGGASGGRPGTAVQEAARRASLAAPVR
ncbi:hypothetical protein OG542_31545 [Streptomyces violaceus]|uniref:hypothetical protein n=1 Tax=Streptomyces violaceus TaxID=1936 RepID=UPI002E1CD16C